MVLGVLGHEAVAEVADADALPERVHEMCVIEGFAASLNTVAGGGTVIDPDVVQHLVGFGGPQDSAGGENERLGEAVAPGARDSQADGTGAV